MAYRNVTVIFILALLVGCASLATQRMSGSLVKGLLNHDDPATVRAAIPAYLVLLDGLINEDPGNESILISASQLYNAFSSLLAEDSERSLKMANHARKYADMALCIRQAELCHPEDLKFNDFLSGLENSEMTDLAALYAYATSSANWIKSNTGDFNAMMQLPKIQAMLEKIIAIDPGFAAGRAQLYLAVMNSQLPASLGGKPEKGKLHFEQALAYSNNRDLIAKVEYARSYARLVFDQELHDRLLKEVINDSPVELDLTLSNVMAQQQAKELLNDGYF